MNPILTAATIMLLICTSLNAQTDFFWSFDDIGSGALNSDASGDFEIGDKVTLYLYYSTYGPAQSDIDTGLYLDIATSAPGVIEFTEAAIWDFEIGVGGTPIGSRWFGGVSGQTGDVSASFIDELHASNFGNSGKGLGMQHLLTQGAFYDKGWDFHADAFFVGEIDFTVVGAGTVEVLTSIGDGGIIHQGQFITTDFGNATINVGMPIPEPGCTSTIFVACLITWRRSRVKR